MTIKDALINIVDNAFDELDKQPQRVETTDYIRRESVGNLCLKNLEIINGRCYVNMEELLNLVDGIPAADVEPVVPCKGCEHAELYARTDGTAGYYCGHPQNTFVYGERWDRVFKPVKNPDDFCSFGEPKEVE